MVAERPLTTSKIIMLVVTPAILTLEIVNTPRKLIHRVKRAAIALIATVRVIKEGIGAGGIRETDLRSK